MTAGIVEIDLRKESAVVLPEGLLERLIACIRERLPRKSFGYLLSDRVGGAVTDFLLLETNVRNTDFWRPQFEEYGRYFVDHQDAGFVATPEEAWRVQREIWARGLCEVGVFHSHQRHPANFSRIDYDLHTQRFVGLWHLIVSMRNPGQPQVRAFTIADDGGVREAPIAARHALDDGRGAPARTEAPAFSTKDAAIDGARAVLRLDRRGLPVCGDARRVLTAMEDVRKTGDPDAFRELVTDGFLRDSTRRFDEHVAAEMQHLSGVRFALGTSWGEAQHFIGESPRRSVDLSPFEIARVPVTNALFALLDPRRGEVLAADRQKPVVNVSWFEAALLALWLGCRLPTEAEWEFACGAGGEGEWCCEDERLLPRYAWYSENSGSETHAVATRAPNALGLFDLHGNVWEWCRDAYDQDYYAFAPSTDPCHAVNPAREESGCAVDMVCRGGSMLALAEMCRTRYRFHEPAGFAAADLGFRLARRPAAAPAGDSLW